jgi:hypothetical protein
MYKEAIFELISFTDIINTSDAFVELLYSIKADLAKMLFKQLISISDYDLVNKALFYKMTFIEFLRRD